MRRIIPVTLLTALSLLPSAVHAMPATSRYTVVVAVSTLDGLNVLSAHTRIGAQCGASFIYDGGISHALTPAIQQVGPSGIVQWSWRPGAGAGTASAACLWKGQLQIGLVRFAGGHAGAGVRTVPQAPAGNTLLSVTGKYPDQSKTDTATFTLRGAFSIHYTSAPIDTSQYAGGSLFQILVESSDKSVYDLVLNSVTDTGKPTPNATAVLRSDDCSGGCFLEVTAANLRYSIQVTH